MTQPDGTFPDNASNADSFAGFASKTQGDYEAERNDAEENRWGGGILGFLFSGIPAFDFLQQIVSKIIGFIPGGNLIIDLLDALFGWSTDTTGAIGNNSAAVAELNAQLAGIASGTDALSDNFDRSAADLGVNWSETYGAGAGSFATDGNNATWDVSGGGSRVGYARYLTPLTTDNQLCSIVQTKPKNSSNTDPDLRLILRADSTMTNFVLAIIRYNSVEIGYVVAGVYTRLGSVVAVTAVDNDRWEFRAGTAGDERQFQLFRNGGTDPVCDVTDSGDVSVMGGSNLFVGFGMLAGVNFVAFLGFLQSQPPSVQGWAAVDRMV